jgi:hypothetical protein
MVEQCPLRGPRSAGSFDKILIDFCYPYGFGSIRFRIYKWLRHLLISSNLDWLYISPQRIDPRIRSTLGQPESIFSNAIGLIAINEPAIHEALVLLMNNDVAAGPSVSCGNAQRCPEANR